MGKIIIAAIIALIPCAALAEQSSILCKTTDTGEFIDVVAKGNNDSEVLFQVNGGKFLDGFATFDNPLLKVIVPLDSGTIAMYYNIQSQKGGMVATVNNNRQVHELNCVFR